MKYCEAVNKTVRRPTREVMVGHIGVGGDNPIRTQSMTTSDTKDVNKTVEQIIRLADSGCDIVRMTVQGKKEAQACELIKNELEKKGYKVPLVADIHFYPPAAMTVVDFVDKVRINPGNFVDKRATFKVHEYNDESYQKELDKIEEKFSPLVEKCQTLGRAMRIGTNHGSLSDRIMNRYGDTPQGMVESALEFARICRKQDYHDFLFSMKASNPKVMIQAYRLLVAKMYELNWDYPLHLGVTEAGTGEDGRVKSAIGIGSLLLDGIGDTIRVSLTEDPWYEIDPCQRLKKLAEEAQKQSGVSFFQENHRSIESIQRRETNVKKTSFLHPDGAVLLSINQLDNETLEADAIVLEKPIVDQKLLPSLHKKGIGVISNFDVPGSVKLLSLQDLHSMVQTSKFDPIPLQKKYAVTLGDEKEQDWECLKKTSPSFILFSPKDNRLHRTRRFFEWLQNHSLKHPVSLAFTYEGSKEDIIIQASSEIGALLCDGYGDGICLKTPYELEFSKHLSFNILQGSRMRSTKTEFISCPSCGRTLFDLQEVTNEIRERTSHLPGVKIAVMGCIVNGPGEMADADFGYVGSRAGMIDLYVGKECVEKNIDFAQGPDRLIELIKKHDRWIPKEELVLGRSE